MSIKRITSRLNLNNEEFHFQFQSHPNYPSALAFSDTLNFFGVKNEAYELEKEYWHELPKQFVTIYKNKFALVHRNGDQCTVFTDKEEKIPFKELRDNSTDFIILFEKTMAEKSVQMNTLVQTIIVFFIGGILLLNCFLNWNLWSFIYQILSLVGFYLFLEIFKLKAGTESPVLQNFCGGRMQRNTSKDNCKTIIQSKDFQILGLKVSDFGFIYFISLVIIPLVIANTSTLFLMISGLSLLSVVYSVYYQISRKTFCRICGFVIGILILQFVIALLLFNTQFELREILAVSVIFLISFVVINYLSILNVEKSKIRKQNIKNLRFKRNYEIFKSQLINKQRISFQTASPFLLGDNNAKLHIAIVSNPYCGFCKDAHKIMKELLVKYPNDISAEIRFNYFPENADKHYTTLLSDFISIYRNKSQQDFMAVVEEWFVFKDEYRINQKADRNSDENLQLFEKTSHENLRLGLSFTPLIIINGYQFPTIYDREDIFYFIDDLIEDEEIFDKKIQYQV